MLHGWLLFVIGMGVGALGVWLATLARAIPARDEWTVEAIRSRIERERSIIRTPHAALPTGRHAA
ncbi:hypothetical protein [Nocardia sp. NPDC057668]|uniref:hypothetical protein n=1 Tax=Nocardia sp. NPDC057668 TaxID=3346202 RepID=UPI00366FED65